MSSSLRQSDLFAGEEWQALYTAFTQINFNASDPPSIAQAMREYLQTTFPEDYNDYIESSEFMFLLELIAWVAGTLAFRTDVNARENFLESAQARESVLRLARFLSYNPSRNQPATGLLKLVQVETTDDVVDSSGINLNNTAVVWNDPDDVDWFERITLILNAAFVNNNPFGQPISSGTVNGINVQTYRLNARLGDQNLGFTASTNGQNMSFEICNCDFTNLGTFFERDPNPDSAFQFYYLNDGNGNDSPNTGFQVLFKQGTSSSQLFNISTPIENQTIDITTTGINNNDVWVFTVNDSGSVTTDWTKVPAVFSQNITFNNIIQTNRNIFSVITRDNDAVTIRFSDGRFAAAPVGNINVVTRSSNGLQYQINPSDISQISMPFTYTNQLGSVQTITLTFSLQTAVNNSTPAETTEQVRTRATQVYATQSRMVSGEDYNIFPIQSNIAAKLNAVNRVYSGHSRFIDLNDPTGNYQDTNVFSDDGIFYKDERNGYIEVPISLDRTPSEMVALYIQPLLDRQETYNYGLQFMIANKENVSTANAVWQQSSVLQYSSTGYIQNIDSNTNILPGAMMQVVVNNKPFWVSISEVNSSFYIAPITGYKGPVTLSTPIPNNTPITTIVPRFDATLDSTTTTTVLSNFTNFVPFTLWYDFTQNPSWSVGAANTSTTPLSIGTNLKVLTADYVGGVWILQSMGIRYVFESVNNVRWYFNGSVGTDATTGLAVQDIIKVLASNLDPNTLDTNGNVMGRGLPKAYSLTVDSLINYSDGYAEPRRIGVRFTDSFISGIPDDPDTFMRIVPFTNSVPNPDSLLFWATQSDGTVLPYYGMTVIQSEADRPAALSLLSVGSPLFQIQANAVSAQNSFWVVNTDNNNNKIWAQDFTDYSFAIGTGPNVAKAFYNTGLTLIPPLPSNSLSFQWKHYAASDHRIDPSKTNIIDIFVLTTTYDYLVRQWIAAGADPSSAPTPPTELDLRLAFASFEEYKMFSDDIVWRPVNYKFLFGKSADEELQVVFKVVPLPNSPYSNGEIQSMIINAINTYFAIQYWDFGETFYYTELAAYIHQSLAGAIGSVVIVPLDPESSFGDGFEVSCRSDEIFISTAQVSDIQIISSNTATNLRIK